MGIFRLFKTTSGTIARDGKGNTRNVTTMKDEHKIKQLAEERKKLTHLKFVSERMGLILQLEGEKEKDKTKINENNSKIQEILLNSRRILERDMPSLSVEGINLRKWFNIEMAKIRKNGKDTNEQINDVAKLKTKVDMHISTLEKKLKI